MHIVLYKSSADGMNTSYVPAASTYIYIYRYNIALTQIRKPHYNVNIEVVMKKKTKPHALRTAKVTLR